MILTKRSSLFAILAVLQGFYFIGGSVFADTTADANRTKMTILNNTNSPVVQKYYKDANVSETNVSKYNTKDWEALLSKDGHMGTSSIGNAMSIFSGRPEGKMAVTGDLEKMKTSELKNNANFVGNKGIGAFDSVLQSAVVADVVANAYGKPSAKSKNIKCYVTRDIGQTFVCTAPGNSLMMSSGMGGRDSLSKLKNDCEGQCFKQSSCVDMQNNEQNISDPTPSKSFTLKKASPVYTFTIPTRSDLTINTLDISEIQKTAHIKYTITYVDQKGNTRKLVEKLLSSAGNLNDYTLYIGDITSAITVAIELATPYPDSISADFKLDSIRVNYHTNAQYVCPSVQDITNITPGDFANKCSLGKKTTLSKTSGSISKTYIICANAIYPGQNPDGSFFQKSACESVCRKQYECKLLPGGSVNFEGLKGFREGCIENTSLSCNNFNEDCKNARLNLDAKVVNELVFDGNLRPIPTIVNGATTGVERPRLSISSMSPSLGVNGGTYAPNDTEFETQKKEEWKDKAYSDMMSTASWNVTGAKIGENTPANHAYGINLKNGSFYGFAGTSVRALMWKLKPAAFDVGTGQQFKLYSIVKTVVQNYRYNQSGTGEMTPYFDEVWYIKMPGADTFKPFYYNYDAYEILSTTDDYNLSSIQFRPKTTSQPKYQSFDGAQWYSIGESEVAEKFRTEDFSGNNAFWEYEIFENMEAKYDTLPGLIRRIEKNGEYDEIIHYTGPIDYGSASSIVKISVAAGYSTADLTYRNLMDMVNSGAITTIYETGNENSFPRYFRGDGEKDNNVVIYMYGQQNNGSAYFNVRPRKDHIGKKGFIYVFGE